MSNLRERAARIPQMDPGPQRDQYFRDAVSDVLKKWRNDRSNMSNFWRTFFGEGLLEPGGDFAKDVFKETVKGAAAGGLMGSIMLVPIPVVAVGLSIGLLVHGAQSYIRVHNRERENNYRYLTIMEKGGVVFRSDLGSTGTKKFW